MPLPSDLATQTLAKRSAYAAWDASLELTEPWLRSTDIGSVLRLAPKEVLYNQGDSHDCFYLVRSGFIHTTVTRPDGSMLLLEIFGPGALFGEASAFIDKPRYVSATAVTPAVVSRYRANEVLHTVAQRPELLLVLLRLLGFKHRLLIDKLASFTSTGPEERVLDLLCRVAMANRHLATQQPKLTHEQIASMTALSRVTVTRTLKGLAERGLVATRSKGVEIKDPDALIEMLGGH